MNARRLTPSPYLLLSVLLLAPIAAAGEPPASPFAEAVGVSPSGAPATAVPTPLHAPPDRFPFGFGQAPLGLQPGGAAVTSAAPGAWASLHIGLSVYGALAVVSWLASLAWAATRMRRQPLDRGIGDQF